MRAVLPQHHCRDRSLPPLKGAVVTSTKLLMVVWKACSSLAHGDIGGTLRLTDKEAVATAEGVMTVRITGSILLLFWCAGSAVAVTAAAFRLYRQRATA